MKLYFCFWLLFLGPITYSALGNPSPPKGTLKDAEFIIEKERKHVLPKAFRLFKQPPGFPCVPDRAKPLTYALSAIVPGFTLLPCKPKILRARQDVLTQHYDHAIKGGYGNFHTPYLEGFLDHHHSNYGYGLHCKHLSTGRVAYGEETHNLIELYGNLFIKALSCKGTMYYDRARYPLYHADNSTAGTQQPILHQFKIANTLTHSLLDTFDYQLDACLHYLRNASKTCEVLWGVNGTGDYALNADFTLRGITDLYLTKHHATTAIYRNVWRLKPTLAFTLNNFAIQGGVNLVYQNEVANAVPPLTVYPLLAVQYTAYKWIEPYVGIGGDIQETFLKDLVQENPLIASNTTLRHTNQRFVFYGGTKGNVADQLAFHTGMAVGSYQNLHCLVNHSEDPGRFSLAYDPEAMLLNVFGQFTHTNLAETLTTRLRGDYFHYTLKELSKPWHRPCYQLELYSTYRLYDKIFFKGTLSWLGGLEALDVQLGVPRKLADVVDLGIGMDYWWNARLVIFCQCKNLLAKRNERYLHYPTRGLHYMAGLSYVW